MAEAGRRELRTDPAHGYPHGFERAMPDSARKMRKFPAGKHDDAVDMLALIGRAVDEAHPMLTAPPPPKKKKRDKWDEAFERVEYEAESWKRL